MTSQEQAQLVRMNAKLARGRRALSRARSELRSGLQIVAQVQDELDELLRHDTPTATTEEAQNEPETNRTHTHQHA